MGRFGVDKKRLRGDMSAAFKYLKGLLHARGSRHVFCCFRAKSCWTVEWTALGGGGLTFIGNI